jgi:hypothetical protein
MSIPQYKFGTTTVAKIRDSEELKQMLDEPWLDADTIIIKPNWVSTDPAEFTDADTLRMFCQVFGKSHLVITESYSLAQEEFGVIDHHMIEEAKTLVWDWFSLNNIDPTYRFMAE